MISIQDLLAKGNLWTKEMEMRLTDNDLILLDGETQVRKFHFGHNSNLTSVSITTDKFM